MHSVNKNQKELVRKNVNKTPGNHRNIFRLPTVRKKHFPKKLPFDMPSTSIFPIFRNSQNVHFFFKKNRRKKHLMEITPLQLHSSSPFPNFEKNRVFF